MTAHPYLILLSIVFLLATLSGCNSPNQTNRVATHDLKLNAVVIRHDDHLLVQVTLNPKNNPNDNLILQERERLEVQLGTHTVQLELQWHEVYSAEMPYQDLPLTITLHRRENRNKLTPIHSKLYLDTPEFLSPQPQTLFQTQAHSVISLQWQGQPADRGQYQLFCTDRTQGLTQVSGYFLTTNRQQVDIALYDLLTQHDALDQRALCEGIFSLHGVSTRAEMATELGGGSFLFESNVSRPVIIRHNRMLYSTPLQPS